MSSIEFMISEIEEDYNRILNSFKTYLSGDKSYGFKEVSEEKLLRLLRSVMSFQRKVEYSTELTFKLVKNKEYLKRLEDISIKLLNKISTDDTISSVYQGYVEYSVIGIIPELKNAHDNLLHNNDESTRRGCYRAYFGFKLYKLI